jgi:hypothetical protein
LAEIDRNVLADRPVLGKQAATEVIKVKPEADADAVLVWVARLRAHRWSAKPGREV